MPKSAQKLYFEFDPFKLAGVEKPTENVDQARRIIADYVEAEVRSYIQGSNSPVAGEGKFKGLSKDYKKLKSKIAGSTKADLKLFGDMLESLDCVVKANGMLELRVKGSKQAAKADGHCNHTGKSKLPERRFIPDDGQKFKRSIVEGIREIADLADED